MRINIVFSFGVYFLLHQCPIIMVQIFSLVKMKSQIYFKNVEMFLFETINTTSNHYIVITSKLEITQQFYFIILSW